MFLSKNSGCDSCQTSMPRNDIFTNIDIDQKYIKNEEKNFSMMPGMGMGMKSGNCGCVCNKGMNPMMSMGGCKMQPVYEQPIEKCIHRTICHEVPHVCPINTKIINHHVYKHTYSPCYSCCEENEVCQINEGSCCCFK